MDALRQQMLRVQQQLNGLSASQKMLTASLVAIMVMTTLWWGRFAATPAMEPLLDQPMAVEDLSRIKSFLSARGVPYRVEGDRVLLPADRRFEAWVDLGYAQLLPKDSAGGFEKALRQMTPWDTQAKTRELFNHGKEQMLGQIIGSFPGVAAANVVLDTRHVRRVEGEIKPSASIRIRTQPGHDATQELVQAAAEFVANAHAGLELGRITVVINGTSRRVRGASGDAMAGADDFIERRHAAEGFFAEKIYDQLAFIPGVRASVTVRLNTRSSTTTAKRVEDVRQSERETHSTLEQTTTPVPASAGEPGVVSNTALTAYPAGGTREAATSSVENNRTTFENFPTLTEEVSQNPAGDAMPIAAAVQVPRSYLVGVWRQHTAAAADAMPTPQELATLIEEEKATIRQIVQHSVGIDDATRVTVAAYYDVVTPVEQAQGPSAASAVGGMLGGHAKTIALTVLAVSSLVAVTMIARRGSADASGTVPDFATLAYAGHDGQVAGGGHTGDPAPGRETSPSFAELGEHGGLLEAQELDDDVIEGQQMLEQVSTLVKENPDAAANLVRRWISR